MTIARVNGVDLHYRLDGDPDRPVLVLSNSLGTDLHLWSPQMPAFCRDFHVLRYDTRGHGKSEVVTTPYAIDDLADDVVALIDHLGFAQVSFCGLSMGGIIGLSLGLRAPARIEKLVLANTAARIGSAVAWNARIAAVRAQGMASIVDAVTERWFTRRFIDAEPAVVATLQQTLRETPTDGYAACCAAVRDLDASRRVGAIDRPLLVIGGRHDLATPPADTQAIATAVRGALYVELDAGHIGNIEAADAFSAAVVDFLKSA